MMSSVKKIKAEIGVFGGSGFYDFLNIAKELDVKTPYGSPSDKITVGSYGGKNIAFLPRHGKNHQYPPHKIPYLANIWAFKSLGVRRIIAPCAVGSLKRNIKPGDFVICDQLVNLSAGRRDTFYDGPKVAHVSLADPYCPDLRKIFYGECKKSQVKMHKNGTIVVINGPRFSTKAESAFFSKFGDIINMTAYPEAVLAREQGMCYLNVAFVTDYDAGLSGGPNVKAVTTEDVAEIFHKNNKIIKKAVFNIIEKISSSSACDCANHINRAFFN